MSQTIKLNNYIKKRLKIYIGAGISYDNIAKKFDVSPHTIKKWCDEIGIRRKYGRGIKRI